MTLIMITSAETIKPSSPTPPHLKTHNLSVVDHIIPNVNIPFIFFYKNYNNGDINLLKKSLSQTLTSYYPFAGRRLSVPQIDCNDQGVEFFEASNDSRLIDFIHKKEVDETIDQLIPNKNKNNNPASLVDIQLNHFTCGGAAVAVTISHKVGDAFTMSKFINHWATVTRTGETGCLKNPTFVPSKISEFKIPEVDLTNEIKYATRRFIFPNSKLKELKNKVNVINATRVDLVSSLIYKCAMGAATTLSGSLQPSKLHQVVNMRNRIIEENRPEIAAGNICTIAVAKMAAAGSSEMKLEEVIVKLRKDITEIKEVRDVEEVGEVFLKKLLSLEGDQSRTYYFSSMCWFPFYEADFGWGKPVQVMLKNGVLGGNMIHLLDTPSGDGIEAIVHLEKEEMDVFQKDAHILAYSTQDMIISN
ncbi:hypothetical protein QVD17_03510 [Tagetes erecta]|uniref:Transferase, Chloramphenicol acetyltransferase-like domain protein n=1 Tax=Tagetes erecta TaxID=13708 RepID=A0AAD8L8G5_TARER|nr:hypothetical protein QVD17_03510 [Tagetes erecta]